jgi:hypothetical protein
MKMTENAIEDTRNNIIVSGNFHFSNDVIRLTIPRKQLGSANYRRTDNIMEKGQIEKYMIYKLLCRKYKYEQHKLLVFYKTIFYDVYKYIIKKTTKFNILIISKTVLILNIFWVRINVISVFNHIEQCKEKARLAGRIGITQHVIRHTNNLTEIMQI